MKLFASASAKLSDDALEILQSKSCEMEKLCNENDVLIKRRSDQSNSALEVTGKFIDLITVYNKLAEYLESNFRIVVDQYEIRQQQSVHVNKHSTEHIADNPHDPDSIQVPLDKHDKQEVSSSKKTVPSPIIFEFPSMPTDSTQQQAQGELDQKPENKNRSDQDRRTSDSDTVNSKYAKEQDKSISSTRKLRQKRTQAPHVQRQNLKKVKSNNQLALNNRKGNGTDGSCNKKQFYSVSTDSGKLKGSQRVTEQYSVSVHKNKIFNKDFKTSKKRKIEGAVCTAKMKIFAKRKGKAKEKKPHKVAKQCSKEKGEKEHMENNDTQYTEKEEESNLVENPEETEEKQLETGLSENDNGKLLQCTQCEKNFKCRKQLIRHEKRHCNPAYCCKKCGKLYKSQKSYQDHEKSHEEGYVKPEFVCRDCGKAFSTKYVLQNHVKSEHLGMKKSYLCPTCGKSFTQKNSYLLHANVHLGIRPFICEICGDSFPYEKSLKEHKYMHDDIRRFKCKECGKSFRQPSALHTHMKVHKDSREHLCGTCGKGFTQKQALSRHERIHSGDKPFCCNLCSRTFSDSSVIRRHMLMVHKMSQSDWRTEVTSNTTPHKGFFVEMPEGHIQPQLKKRGRPPAKEKESEEHSIRSEVVENLVQNNTNKNDLVADQRANAALTLSSLAVGALETLPITKSSEHVTAEAPSFLQKPTEQMHCEISQSLPISNTFMGIANYTVVQSTPIQPSVPRALENQQLLFSNLTGTTPSISHLQTMDKETLLPQTSETFQEVEDPSAVRTDQWSGGQYQYMYLTNYSQFHQIQ